MAWFGIWFDSFNTCDGVWSNGAGQNRETDEVHDEDCVNEGCLLAGVKHERDDEGNREALGAGNCSINIWDGSELRLPWSKKSSPFFKNKFPILL